MRIDRSYLGNQNTYAENNPKCIVVHNTDNFAAGADARAHARAQHDGNFQNISAHYYVDDGDTAYQAAPHSRGCWHVGINYGGKNLFQQYGNKNSIGVEMCVQAGYNYEKAFENTAALVREIMRETGIPLERVYRHYDICSKYCPSQIMNRGDWDRMKRMIGSGAGSTGTGTAGSGTGKTYAPGIYQVQTAALNIRQAPDADSRIAGTIRDHGSYTVTEIQNTSWGRLLSGAGWVNCHTAYCRYAGPAKEKSAETAKSSGKTVAEDGIWGENLTGKTNGAFGGGIKNRLRYALGLRGLYALFGKLRAAMTEGFKNLAQFSSGTNKSLSNLKSSLTQLKNALATAFAPILQTIEPILTRFINMLSKAADYIARFTAALTGKSSYTRNQSAGGLRKEHRRNRRSSRRRQQEHGEIRRDQPDHDEGHFQRWRRKLRDLTGGYV